MSSGDRVTTPEGAGVIVREVRNTYLLRPGKAFEVELDDGRTITTTEQDITTP